MITKHCQKSSYLKLLLRRYFLLSTRRYSKSTEKEKWDAVPVNEVQRFIVDCMKSVGTKADHAASLGDNLTAADHRGHYSHGLNRLGNMPFYCQFNYKRKHVSVINFTLKSNKLQVKRTFITASRSSSTRRMKDMVAFDLILWLNYLKNQKMNHDQWNGGLMHPQKVLTLYLRRKKKSFRLPVCAETSPSQTFFWLLSIGKFSKLPWPIIESWFRVLTEGHFLRLTCRNREAEFKKLGRNFVIMG